MVGTRANPAKMKNIGKKRSKNRLAAGTDGSKREANERKRGGTKKHAHTHTKVEKRCKRKGSRRNLGKPSALARYQILKVKPEAAGLRGFRWGFGVCGVRDFGLFAHSGRRSTRKRQVS